MRCSRSSKSTVWFCMNSSFYSFSMKLRSMPDFAIASCIFKLMKLVISRCSLRSISFSAYMDFYARISSFLLSCSTSVCQMISRFYVSICLPSVSRCFLTDLYSKSLASTSSSLSGFMM